MDKLRNYFAYIVVNKNLKGAKNSLRALKLPSYLRDWLLQKFTEEDGSIKQQELLEYIEKYMPRDFKKVKNVLITEHDPVCLVTRIQADLSIDSGEASFTLPLYGVDYKNTFIEPEIWSKYSEELIGSDIWARIQLEYQDAQTNEKGHGKLLLKKFRNFCPYKVDLSYYQQQSQNFTVHEWIDVLLGAIDYNAKAFPNEAAKLAMLSRLLPFVENNLNIIELAPKGTGKSYTFRNISRYGMLTDGGNISRASMFYNAATRQKGFIVGHDFVAIDEVKLVKFGSDVNEMRSIMQGYMADGKYNFSGVEAYSDAGIVFLGNIDQSRMDVRKNMLVELPSLFRESALLDRIHGFICGWEIPILQSDMEVCDWAMNTEYFSSIMHLQRRDTRYADVVEKLVPDPRASYKRHVVAVKRLATAFLKLLFPYATDVSMIDPMLFKEYCLLPAVRMRSIIHGQLKILDSAEYGKPNKAMPQFVVKGVDE